MAAITADVLSFRSPRFRAVDPPPDLPVQAVSLLGRLRDSLQLSAELFASCELRRQLAERKRIAWGEPQLFFFNQSAQAELVQQHSRTGEFPEPYLREVSDRLPAAFSAWQQLPDLLDDALTVLPASVECRRVARATVGLARAAALVGQHHRGAREVAELLAMPDEEVVLVVDLERRLATRVLLTGVADVHQLMILLADVLPHRRRPDPKLVVAYRSASVSAEASTAVAPFQLLRPKALQADGSVPAGFAASDHWLWGRESTADLPRENGERVLLLTATTVPHTWDVGRRFPRLPGRIDFVETLSSSALAAWFRARCPEIREPIAELIRAA